jgi:ribosomal-protein-alanine N-acetyltransferase
MLSVEAWHERASAHHREYLEDRALRIWIFDGESPDIVRGSVQFTAIQRGPAQFCYLGYGLAAADVGKGLMLEALRAAIPFAFADLRLHRIMANHVPDNQRSARLLERLGFVVEGLACEYLMLDGSWQDHVLTSLTNRDWRP